jgi:hypothetical protein
MMISLSFGLALIINACIFFRVYMEHCSFPQYLWHSLFVGAGHDAASCGFVVLPNFSEELQQQLDHEWSSARSPEVGTSQRRNSYCSRFKFLLLALMFSDVHADPVNVGRFHACC